MTGNLYETTLSDLIAKGDTHLEVVCICTHTVWMPLRLMSLPCGTSIKELRNRLKCGRCTRRPFSIEGVNAANHGPEPGRRSKPPSGWQKPPAQPEVATPDSPIIPEANAMPFTPIPAGLGPGGANLQEFTENHQAGTAPPDL